MHTSIESTVSSASRSERVTRGEQPVLTATVDDLNRNRLEAFFGRSPTIPWLDLLRNTRVTVADEHGVDRPTVAALLVFGREPTDLLASGSIEAACYRDTRLSSDDLVHAERLAGPVSDQIDGAAAGVRAVRRRASADLVDEIGGCWLTANRTVNHAPASGTPWRTTWFRTGSPPANIEWSVVHPCASSMSTSWCRGRRRGLAM